MHLQVEICSYNDEIVNPKKYMEMKGSLFLGDREDVREASMICLSTLLLAIYYPLPHSIPKPKMLSLYKQESV